MLWPKEAAQFIYKHSKNVFINKEQIKHCAAIIAAEVKAGKLEMEAFKQNEVLPMDKNLSEDQLANWIFLVDALNFNFWTSKGLPKFSVTHDGKTRSGYMAMVLSVNRAIDEGKPMYDPDFYSHLTLDEIKEIFRSDTESSMPLLEERIRVLKEIGSILINKYNGNFVNVLKAADRSALKLVDIVASDFPCFNDVHTFQDETVAIFKRPQILAADIAMLYQEKAPGNFKDLDQLTMFADYRVPQALVHFKILSYSDSLQKKLEQEQLLENGSREEVEIRGVSIHACELLAEETRIILKDSSKFHINSIKIDYFLWDYRYNHSEELENIPYHKTRCIYY